MMIALRMSGDRRGKLVYKEFIMEQLLVGVDVGSCRHCVAIGMPNRALIDRLVLEHRPAS
jgi:hypothetical protein